MNIPMQQLNSQFGRKDVINVYGDRKSNHSGRTSYS
jgi:hypothetical protein